MRLLVSMLVSAGGAAMVFGLLLAMNRSVEAPKLEPSAPLVEMQVAPKPPPKKKESEPKPRERKTSNKPQAPPPPMPAMGGGLSAVSLGMPRAEMGFDEGFSGLLDAGQASVMTEDSVDSKPRPMSRSAAAYPARARAEGITGFVTMNLLINERGEVERTKILRAEPPGVFEETAQNSVRSWSFEPAMYGGEPVKVWASQTLRFELK